MIYTAGTKKALKVCFEAHKDQVDKAVPRVLQHLQKSGTLKIPPAITIVAVGLDLRPAVEHYEFGKQFILILDADGFISGDIVFRLGGVGGIVHAQPAVDADLI